MRFAGKSILITGAASGIGKAVAELLARDGAKKLILVDADAKGLDALRLDVNADKLFGNVADPDFWASADIGSIDHAVINAGVAGAERSPTSASRNGGTYCRSISTERSCRCRPQCGRSGTADRSLRSPRQRV